MKDKQIGIKHDETKTQWSLLPWDVLEEIVEVMQYGAQKYGTDNWKYVDPPMRYWDAAMRHMIAFREGERVDESTHLHLAHAITSLIFLMWHDNRTWDEAFTQALAELRGAQEDMK